MNKKYIFLEHTADVKFQAFGKNIEEAFSNSAFALREVMTEKARIKDKIKKKIVVKGKDKEKLLYNFLEEFLVLFDSKEFVLSKIKRIKIEDNKLEAEISGDDARNYKFSNSVKAITYNQMLIKQEKGKWIVQVVLDV
ncbi:MAG: archease [archaeon]|nr:archease [archaeon]